MNEPNQRSVVFNGSEIVRYRDDIPLHAGMSVSSVPIPPLVRAPVLKHVYYPALDGVRGIAVAAVLISHAAYVLSMQSTIEYGVKKTFSPLWFGVNIFFVLSGFLITGILTDTKNSNSYFGSFYAKRTLRIFPLYFSVLLFAFVVLPSLGLVPATRFSEQIYFWTYLYNWQAVLNHGAAIDLGHFWTLAIEEQFYLLWPIVVFAVSRRTLPAICLAVGLASFCFRSFVAIDGMSLRWDYFSTPAQIGGLCLGGFAACALRDRTYLAFFQRHARQVTLFAITLIVAAAAIGRGFESDKGPALVFGQTGIEIMAALVILLSAAGTLPFRFQRLLNARPLKWLGKYSYGIYVFHIPIRDLIHRYSMQFTSGNAVVRLSLWIAESSLMISMSCLLAYLSFTFYESRFLRLKRRFAFSGA